MGQGNKVSLTTTPMALRRGWKGNREQFWVEHLLNLGVYDGSTKRVLLKWSTATGMADLLFYFRPTKEKMDVRRKWTSHRRRFEKSAKCRSRDGRNKKERLRAKEKDQARSELTLYDRDEWTHPFPKTAKDGSSLSWLVSANHLSFFIPLSTL